MSREELDCEVYNRPNPGSNAIRSGTHFPAVPVTMEEARDTHGTFRCAGHRSVWDCRWAWNRV